MSDDIAKLPGLEESELARCGPCAICGKPLLNPPAAPTFYHLTVSRAAFLPDAIRRRIGLAKIFDGPHEIVVHEACAGEINHLLELIEQATPAETEPQPPSAIALPRDAGGGPPHSRVCHCVASEKMQAARQLIDTDKVLELLGGVSYSTVWRMTREGKFPLPVRVGGLRRWYADEVAEAIDALPRGAGRAPGRAA